MLKQAAAAIVACALSLTVTGADVPPPLEIEETGKVESLPASYPESWLMRPVFLTCMAAKLLCSM